jgi:hypothetical protein
MEERGVTEEDIRTVISAAEEKKTFVRDGDTIIGKSKLGNMTVYVVYEKDGELFRVQSTYSHRVSLVSEKE